MTGGLHYHSLYACLSGILGYVFLCHYPLRGDTALLMETFHFAIVQFATRRLSPEVYPNVLLSVKILTLHLAWLCLSAVVYRASPFHPLARFPGPRINKITSLRLVSMTTSGMRHQTIIDLHKKYGKIVRTGPNTLSINSHEAVGPIYAHSQALDKSSAYIMGRVPGKSIFFTTDRQEHEARRKLWSLAFTPEAIRNFESTVFQSNDRLCEKLAADAATSAESAIDLYSYFPRWSWDIMANLTFGDAYDMDLINNGDLGHYFDIGQGAMITFETLGEITSVFDISWYLPFTKELKKLHKISVSWIEKRLQIKDCASNDLLSHLIPDAPITPAILQDLSKEGLFAIQAGSDATTSVATLGLFLLISHPAAYQRLKQELCDAEEAGNVDSFQALSRLPYLCATVSEILRLGTPFPGFPRAVGKQGIVVNGTVIPPGTIVGVPAWAQNVSEENFSPSPMEFIPERWLDGSEKLGYFTRASALLSFSHGPYGCLGKQLAIHELRSVITRLMLRFDLDFAPGFDAEVFRTSIRNIRTTVIEYPLLVIVKSRGKHT